MIEIDRKLTSTIKNEDKDYDNFLNNLNGFVRLNKKFRKQ